MKFIAVNAEQLAGIQAALELIEPLGESQDQYVLYGLTSARVVVSAARACINLLYKDDEENEGFPVPQPREIAISLPLTVKNLTELAGNGCMLSKSTEFYYATGNEGPRNHDFLSLQRIRPAIPYPMVTLRDFSQLALAVDDTWLDDFLKKYSTAQAGQVTRSAPAASDAPTVTTQPEILPPARKASARRASANSNSIDIYLRG